MGLWLSALPSWSQGQEGARAQPAACTPPLTFRHVLKFFQLWSLVPHGWLAGDMIPKSEFGLKNFPKSSSKFHLEVLGTSPAINIIFDLSCVRGPGQPWIPWSNKTQVYPTIALNTIFCVHTGIQPPPERLLSSLPFPSWSSRSCPIKPASHGLLFLVYLAHPVLCFT